MKLWQAIEIISPLSFWVNCDDIAERYTNKNKCTIDGEIQYITVDGNGELTFEITED